MASLPVLLTLACAALSSSAAGHHVRLNPDAMASDLMGEALRYGRFAARELASSDATISAPTRYDDTQGKQYLMTLAIGTPPVSFPAIIDTGSNVIMTQCAPCGGRGNCGFRSPPLYNPSSSSTFSDLPCNSSLRLGFCDDGANDASPGPGCPCTRNQTYGIGWTFFTMNVETFTFGSTAGDQVSVAGMAFGCVKDSYGGGSDRDGGWGGAAGMVGLGRGNLSLVKQLGATRFSYCLTPYDDGNSTSTLRVGPSAVIDDTGVLSTPFVPSPNEATLSTHYYLNLTGISVGDTTLDIPSDAFALSADGGGIIIDSGWTTTALVDVAYQKVRAEILSLVTLPPTDEPFGKLDLCFNASQKSTPSMPDMTFHFDGADMVLPAKSYMYLSSSGAYWCLRMQNASADDGSVFGNYQQQNIHFLFDLEKEVLSFAPADCSKI